MPRTRRPQRLAAILIAFMLVNMMFSTGCAIPPIITQLLGSLGGAAAAPAAGAAAPAAGAATIAPAVNAGGQLLGALFKDEAPARPRPAVAGDLQPPLPTK